MAVVKLKKMLWEVRSWRTEKPEHEDRCLLAVFQ